MTSKKKSPMRTILFDSEAEWLDARRGRVTGTRLGDLIAKRGGGYKIGFYELIAERIALPATDESPMDRGHRLEEDALDRFAKETGKTVDKVLKMWVREDNENIAVSPDGTIGETEAVEVKCLSSARHIEALLTKEIPSEYDEQVLQYFIVNDKLKTLYFVFYDPRMPKDFFYFTRVRADMAEKASEYLEMEKRVLLEIQSIENQLTF
jgi:predicted phage-related endonuclease